MRSDMEAMWQAMKGSYYQHISQKMAKEIRQTENLRQAVSAALGVVVEAIHAETGTVWFYEQHTTGRIYPRAVYGGADLSGVSLLPGEGIAGQVIESGKSLIIRDCQADLRWAGRVDSKTGFTTKSMICVPLKEETLVIGSIQIINQTNGELFDEKDLSFAERLATEVVGLLKEQGLLEEYLPREPERAPELTVRELLACSPKELERRIYAMPEFAAKSARKQQEILKLWKQLQSAYQ